jgi:murein DD-endopeptidase MepM/ murein hydrolase activator NlpD
MKVATGVNDACGGYWDLKMVESPYDPSHLMVVDTKTVENNASTPPVLDMGSVNSIARTWGMSTDLPDALKHSIMMGANSKDEKLQNTHEPTKVWQIYGQGVTDRMYDGLMPNVVCSEESKANENEDCDREEGEKTDTLKDFKAACKDLLDNVGDEECDSAKVAMRAYWSDKQTEGKAEMQVTIPVGFEATMDGIGSLKWGMGFSVKQINQADILPSGYRFMITDVKQEIGQRDWTTKIETQLVLPTEPSVASITAMKNLASEVPVAEEAPTNVQTYEDEEMEIVPNENAEDPELTFKIPTSAGWTIRKDSGGDGRWLAPRGGRQHKGVDLSSAVGDQILSPIDGKVARTAAVAGGMPGTKIFGSGDYDGYIAYLFYCAPNSGMVGKNVKKRDVVATQGDLSQDYPENVGDHVHVAIKKGGQHLDPTLGSGDINWEA